MARRLLSCKQSLLPQPRGSVAKSALDSIPLRRRGWNQSWNQMTRRSRPLLLLLLRLLLGQQELICSQLLHAKLLFRLLLLVR
jgi:hypothetical protein